MAHRARDRSTRRCSGSWASAFPGLTPKRCSGNDQWPTPMNSGIAGDLTGAPQSQVVGAVLGTFIASNHPELREEVLNGVITMAREIWPILIEEMINAGRCEEDWH